MATEYKLNYKASDINSKLGKVDTHEKQIANLDNALAVEKSRIDSLTKLESGSTTGDAELADARVDKDGNTHANVGEHIRNVTSQLSSEIEDIVFIDKNHIDFTSEILWRTVKPTILSTSEKSFEVIGTVHDGNFKGANGFLGWEISNLTIGETYRVNGKFLTANGTTLGDYIAQVMVLSDMSGDALAQNADRSNPNIDFEFVATQETHYLRFVCFYQTTLKVTDFEVVHCDHMKLYEKNLPIIPNEKLPNDVICGNDADLNRWKDKTWLAYGDSITAISNGNGLGLGWAKYINDYFGFKNFYGRGIGGQTFSWNTNTFYANADGSYNSRDTSHNPPNGTTEHKGCFSSWDRIKTMIPDSIKDDIDLILLMGGTNDISNVEESTGESAILYEKPICSADYRTDTDWVNDSEYYLGCDYDVNTFSGAIASTIMKLQVRCPNAIIVVATPISRWYTPDFQPTTTATNEPYENGTHNGVTTMDVADVEIKVSRYMAMPHIDVNGTCSINGFNWSNYMDGVHPYPINGQKMLARAIISGLKTIVPIID